MTSLFDEPYAGRMLLDRHGGRVGRIDAVYVDPQTERPQWGLVRVGFISSRQTLVPLVTALLEDGALRVPWDRQHIRNALTVSLDAGVTPEEEHSLARHYGVEFAPDHDANRRAPAQPAPGAPGPVGPRARATPATAAAASASASAAEDWPVERAHVRRPSELVRVRRTHVEQPVSQRVRLRREEIHLVQEAELDATSPRDHLEAAMWELTLMREEPIVEKRRVPLEHVRVETATDAELLGRSLRAVRVVRDRSDGAM